MKDTHNASETDKARFLRVFAFIGAITSFLMAISSFLDGYVLLSVLLGLSVFVFISPFFVTDKDAIISVFMLYILYFLMCYLVVSGGNNGTGPLWLFIVSPVTFFIRGLKRGARDLVILGVIVSVLFYFTPQIGMYEYNSFYFPTRVMLCFSILCVLAGFYEYYRNKYSLELVNLLEINKRLASIDSLTQLYNRRYTQDILESDDYKGSAAFMLMDVDNFKHINDNYGHQVGDAVLVYISEMLREIGCAFGVVSRWGGEEFLLALKTKHASKVHELSDAIHHYLHSKPFKDERNELHVTLSIGVHLREQGETTDHCLNVADKRLYKAKTNGKDQSVFDDEGMPS
ncbi:diguanylate cyclase [Pseudoalteromonas sp. SSDWG2]|uniref:GGDEF domain-containing protein n=1 Tax=Pseudoalteromonas sp. SSDWG2 TaxID=3139391 RepID=UPI003BACA181